MVERFATILGSLYEDFEIIHHAILSAEVGELQWAQCFLEFLFGRRNHLLSYIKIFVHSMTIIDNMVQSYTFVAELKKKSLIILLVFLLVILHNPKRFVQNCKRYLLKML